MNQDWQQAHAELLEKVSEIEGQVSKLLGRMQADHRLQEQDLVALLSGLDRCIDMLRASNIALATTNQQLERQLLEMDGMVRLLRQQNRRMFWQQTRNKVAIGLVGVGVGFALGSR